MKIRIFPSFAIVCCLVSFISCEEKLYFGEVDCSSCYYPKPDSADLVLSLSFDDFTDAIPLVFYRGDLEDNQIEYIDTAYASPYYLWVAVGQSYSVTAEYYSDQKTIFAVDGTTIEALKVTDACDGDCYVLDDEKLDLRLAARYR